MALSDYSVTLGDVVKLKRPYHPAVGDDETRSFDWPGFEFGIVVEVGPGDRLRLFLYDGTGQLFMAPLAPASGPCVPASYVSEQAAVVRQEPEPETGYFLDGI